MVRKVPIAGSAEADLTCVSRLGSWSWAHHIIHLDRGNQLTHLIFIFKFHTKHHYINVQWQCTMTVFVWLLHNIHLFPVLLPMCTVHACVHGWSDSCMIKCTERRWLLPICIDVNHIARENIKLKCVISMVVIASPNGTAKTMTVFKQVLPLVKNSRHWLSQFCCVRLAEMLKQTAQCFYISIESWRLQCIGKINN